jgi:hypothetical protein
LFLNEIATSGSRTKACQVSKQRNHVVATTVLAF